MNYNKNTSILIRINNDLLFQCKGYPCSDVQYPHQISRWDSLVVSMSASHAVGCGFAPRLGHTTDRHTKGTNGLPTCHGGVRVDVWQGNLTGKDRVVCGTIYGDTHNKNLLGSILRVGYCFLVLDFYLVLHCLWCWKKNMLMDW